MPIDHGGFSDGRGDADLEAAPAAPPRRRRSTLVLMLAGVAGALVLGVLFGLWARPELIGSKPAATPPAAADPGAAQVPLVVAPPAESEPPPRAPGRLETLPPEMAAAARTQGLPSMAPEPGAETAEPSAAARGSASPEAAESPPSPRYVSSFDCATARPGAEEMVCEDPALAAADRRMARAYRRAMRSGVDPDELRQEQRDWTAIREDAAMHSHEALAQVYDQRIEELNRIAEAAPGAPQ